jgi:hypothetical protein
MSTIDYQVIVEARQLAAAVRRRGHESEAEVLARGVEQLEARVRELVEEVSRLRRAADERDVEAAWWRDLVRGA